jgi:hypothetical protein
MRKKSRTLAYRLSMSLTTKTLEHVAPAHNLPRGRAVGRAKVAEAAQQTAQAEAPHAALAAQPAAPAVDEAWGNQARLFDAGAIATRRQPSRLVDAPPLALLTSP